MRRTDEIEQPTMQDIHDRDDQIKKLASALALTINNDDRPWAFGEMYSALKLALPHIDRTTDIGKSAYDEVQKAISIADRAR